MRGVSFTFTVEGVVPGGFRRRSEVSHPPDGKGTAKRGGVDCLRTSFSAIRVEGGWSPAAYYVDLLACKRGSDWSKVGRSGFGGFSTFALVLGSRCRGIIIRRGAIGRSCTRGGAGGSRSDILLFITEVSSIIFFLPIMTIILAFLPFIILICLLHLYLQG